MSELEPEWLRWHSDAGLLQLHGFLANDWLLHFDRSQHEHGDALLNHTIHNLFDMPMVVPLC